MGQKHHRAQNRKCCFHPIPIGPKKSDTNTNRLQIRTMTGRVTEYLNFIFSGRLPGHTALVPVNRSPPVPSSSLQRRRSPNYLLLEVQTEYGILDRMVYKNKNQHRRCSYFQYLLKVRSDLRYLQLTRLDEVVNSSLLVINGERAKQKVPLLESLKRRKHDGGKHNLLERLQGAARLLSKMVEPMLKAAIEISTLLARSFFVGFCMTILALLSWLRVLVQQILLDVVSVFNMVSSLSQKQQAEKLGQVGFEVREYYPTKERVNFLECVWETDKYRLIERMCEPDNKIRCTENKNFLDNHL